MFSTKVDNWLHGAFKTKAIDRFKSSIVILMRQDKIREAIYFSSSTVVIGVERDDAQRILEQIEKESGKNKSKWVRTRDEARQRYLTADFAQPVFQGHLLYAVYRDTMNYPEHTAQTAKRAIDRFAEANYKATIIVDGLEGQQRQSFSNLVRSLGVRYKTIRGVRDETDAFIRLADALCGLARARLSKHPVYAPMLKQMQEKQYLLPL